MQAPLEPSRPALSAAPILVVDDDELARELILRFLRKMGLVNDVVTASDGAEAMRVMADSSELALVLLDLDMPCESGLDVLEQLRSKDAVHFPVIMLTGSAELADIDRAYELGIRSYLVKPVGFAALSDVIRGLHLPWQLLARTRDQK